MKLDGSYTMDAPRQQVFDTLMSIERLRSCLPGVVRFDEVAEGTYETELRAGIAGIKGSFTGTVTLADPKPPESYRLSMQGAFAGGHMTGVGDISLEDQGSRTLVRYSGDAQISGRLAGVGQRLMLPAARTIVNQFFKCMEGQLKQGQA